MESCWVFSRSQKVWFDRCTESVFTTVITASVTCMNTDIASRGWINFRFRASHNSELSCKLLRERARRAIGVSLSCCMHSTSHVCNDYETVCVKHMLEAFFYCALCVLLETCFYCNFDFMWFGFQLNIFISCQSLQCCVIDLKGQGLLKVPIAKGTIQ